MKQYKIIAGSEDLYPLGPRCGKVVKVLRKLQVASTFYTVQERYNFVKEMLWDDEWLDKEEEGEPDEEGNKTVSYQLKPATLDPHSFLEEAMPILFPDANIDPDTLDHEVALEALEDFTARTSRKRMTLSGLFS